MFLKTCGSSHRNTSLIPSFLQSSWVTCAANCGPQSDMMVKGKPVCFHTLPMRSWLVWSTVMVALQGDRMIALLWRSTTVRMLSYPCDVGSPTMKSIVIVSQLRWELHLAWVVLWPEVVSWLFGKWRILWCSLWRIRWCLATSIP